LIAMGNLRRFGFTLTIVLVTAALAHALDSPWRVRPPGDFSTPDPASGTKGLV